MIWTTTPWTLPANVAAAVHPDEEYGRRENGEWVATSLFPKDGFVDRKRGSDLVGWRYRGPFDDLPPGSQVDHRVIPWDDVTMDQGTGIVHIAPGCRRRGLRALEGPRSAGPHTGRRVRALLRRLRLAARRLDHGGRGSDHRTPRRNGLPRRGRAVHARLSALLALRHPAHLPVVGRLVHRGRRHPAEAARRERSVALGALVHGQAHGRLAPQHGRLEHLPPSLLRAPAAVLPVRVRAPERDRVARRARGASCRGPRPAARSSAGRGSTACRSAARVRRDVTRIPEVGDAWLDAGIVNFSTLGWQNPEWNRRATRPAPHAG